MLSLDLVLTKQLYIDKTTTNVKQRKASSVIYCFSALLQEGP